MIWFAPLLSCLSLLFSIASKAMQSGRVIHKYLLTNDRVGCPNRELFEEAPVVDLEQWRNVRSLAARKWVVSVLTPSTCFSNATCGC